MFIKLKYSIALTVIALIAGVFVGYLLFSGEKAKPEPIRTANVVSRKEKEIDYSFVFSTDDDDRAAHSIEGFNIINQLPELPTGCEVTSLTMVMNYYGIETDKMSIARDFLVKGELDPDSYSTLHGPDFRYVFAGSPDNDTSFGCLAPCLVTTAQRYIDYRGASDLYPADLTGTAFDELFDFIDHDIPVIIWSTMGLAAPEYKLSWTTWDGDEVTWPTNEHCVVMTAYDTDSNSVRIHDPVNGVISLNMDAVRERYEQLGSNAAAVIRKQ